MLNTILFLLALLLAWPTFGLSLLAYVAVLVAGGMLEARARRQAVDEHWAEQAVARGEAGLPSWADNAVTRQAFLETAMARATRNGVPESFCRALLADPEALQHLLLLAGAMEYRGNPVHRQGMAVSARIEAEWQNLPLAVAGHFSPAAAAARGAADDATPASDETARVTRLIEMALRLGVRSAVLQVRLRAFWTALKRWIGRAVFLCWRGGCLLAVISVTCVASIWMATGQIEDAAILLGLAVLAIPAVSFAAWWLTRGEARTLQDFDRFVARYALADLSVYAWFLLGTLLLGGAANAIWQGGQDVMLAQSAFAEGAGLGLGLVALGALGGLLAPRRHRRRGHMIGIVAMAVAYGAWMQFAPPGLLPEVAAATAY